MTANQETRKRMSGTIQSKSATPILTLSFEVGATSQKMLLPRVSGRECQWMEQNFVLVRQNWRHNFWGHHSIHTQTQCIFLQYQNIIHFTTCACCCLLFLSWSTRSSILYT